MPSITPEARTVELPLDPEVRKALGAGRLQLCATDAHRLALQAKLTEIGVPPSPGDRGALRQLATMDTESVDAVLRWLSHAAGVPYGLDGRFLTVEPPLAEPPIVDAPPSVDTRVDTRMDAPADCRTDASADAAPDTAASTHPADRMDPRLIAW